MGANVSRETREPAKAIDAMAAIDVPKGFMLGFAPLNAADAANLLILHDEVTRAKDALRKKQGP